ncbi:DUF6010 family protein [Deinococcus sp.]|uniref:DUF6010 family protein n=1 Tax=Deinococcus sp. TaxID=47478 RepID=UPI003CC692FB
MPDALFRSPLRPAAVGLLLAALTLALAGLLPSASALEWLTVVLAVVAAVYVGFGLQDTRRAVVVTEIAYAVFTLGLALGGLWVAPWLLALGYLLHGGWDMLHFWRRPVIGTRLPWWYAAFCLTYDWPVAAYSLWRWA